MNVVAAYEFWEKIQSLGSADTQFDKLVFTMVHLMYILPHFYMIPCHWIEVCKVGRYFTLWYEFQVINITYIMFLIYLTPANFIHL